MDIPICQVALSVSNRKRSRLWYQRLGLEPSGDMTVSGDVPARMLELPEIDLQISWVAGRDPMSQLELMQFLRPTPRPLPKDWGPRYAGYGIVGFIVSNFENTLDRLSASGTQHVTTGAPRSRSLWLRDPDGIPLEIMEMDPLGSRSSAKNCERFASIRTLSLTVGDLGKAKRFWSTALGLGEWAPKGRAFNPFPDHLNGGVGEWEEQWLRGDSLLLRLLQPSDPRQLLSDPGRRLCDLGILNIAVIMDSAASFGALLGRIRRHGYSFATVPPITMGDNAGAIYGRDDQGFSLEMGFVLPGHEETYGWRR